MNLDWLFQDSDRPALVDGENGRVVTYAELGHRAAVLARTFAAVNQERDARGTRIAILCYNRLELFECVWACARAGTVLVPLNWRLSERELDVIVADCAPRVLVFDAEHRAAARNLARAHGIERLLALDPEADLESDPESDPELDDKGPLDGHSLAPYPGRAAVVGGSVADDSVVVSRPGLEDTAVLLYTSGTTGTPKGVMVSWRQLASNAATTCALCDLGAEDRTLVFLPLFHTGGLNCLATPILAAGGTVVVMRHFDAAHALALMARHRITAIIGVPTIYEMLYAAGMDRAELPALRWSLMGGAPPPPALFAIYERMGHPLAQGYGLTEVGPNCFTLGVRGHAPAGSVGKPVPGSEARLLADDGSYVQGPGEGELCLRGAHVTQGYWNRPESTAEVLDADGFFHTGDLARCDQDGLYYIVGRKKDMYISGGENVYPAEIERILLEHPAVTEIAVIGVPDERWGEVGLAFVVADARALDRAGPASDDILSNEWAKRTLGSFLRQRLASYKVPKRWHVLEEMPRTSTGKIAKGELRRRFT